jgi:hypothetical protein
MHGITRPAIPCVLARFCKPGGHRARYGRGAANRWSEGRKPIGYRCVLIRELRIFF